MSLGLSSDVEQDVLDALADLKQATGLQVAWWRLQHQRKPTLGGCEVGLTMMLMELQGRLRFHDNAYEMVKP